MFLGAGLNFRATLSKPAKKGIEAAGELEEAIRATLIDGVDKVVREDGEYFVVLARHPLIESAPDYDKYEAVTVLLLTGFQAYSLRREVEIHATLPDRK